MKREGGGECATCFHSTRVQRWGARGEQAERIAVYSRSYGRGEFMMKIYLASGNAHKVQEFQAIADAANAAGGVSVEFVSAKAVGGLWRTKCVDGSARSLEDDATSRDRRPDIAGSSSDVSSGHFRRITCHPCARDDRQ